MTETTHLKETAPCSAVVSKPSTPELIARTFSTFVTAETASYGSCEGLVSAKPSQNRPKQLGILTAFLAAVTTSSAGAEDVSDKDLALAVARVSVNESGWSSPADAAMIWQATKAHGRTNATRLAWLRRHSWTLFTTLPVPHGNARWTRDLNWEGERPRHWPSNAPAWSHYRKRWENVLRYALGLVTGRIRNRPCPAGVATWGGSMDSAQAELRGLVPLECEGTLNTGYALPDSTTQLASRTDS